MTLQAISPVYSGYRGLRHLLCGFVRLVQTWWAIDRICISPVEGLLLRMPVGTVIRIAGENWLIERMWVCDGATGSLVRYECGNGMVAATLEVHASLLSGDGRIHWRNGSICSELHTADIEVYETAR